MKTFDCFPFFDELDLLELRLATLDPVVDVFVLVESRRTFSGRRKPLHFDENRTRFTPWLHKIRHVVLRPAWFTRDPWTRETASRRAIVRGLVDAAPDDVVFVSDLDEIWRPEKKLDAIDECRVARFHQHLHHYFLNVRRVGPPWRRGTVRVRFADFTDAQALRIEEDVVPIPDGGWHFSYLGDVGRIVSKLRSTSHTEFGTPEYCDERRILEKAASGADLFDRDMEFETVPVDASFPRPMLENPDRWAPFVKVPGGPVLPPAAGGAASAVP